MLLSAQTSTATFTAKLVLLVDLKEVESNESMGGQPLNLKNERLLKKDMVTFGSFQNRKPQSRLAD